MKIFSKQPFDIFITKRQHAFIVDDSYVYEGKTDNKQMLIYSFNIKICSYCSFYTLKMNRDKRCTCDSFLNSDSLLDCEACKPCIKFLEKRFIPIVFYNKSDFKCNCFGNNLTGVEYVLSDFN